MSYCITPPFRRCGQKLRLDACIMEPCLLLRSLWWCMRPKHEELAPSVHAAAAKAAKTHWPWPGLGGSRARAFMSNFPCTKAADARFETSAVHSTRSGSGASGKRPWNHARASRNSIHRGLQYRKNDRTVHVLVP